MVRAQRRARRGASMAQMAMVLVAVTLAVFIGVQFLGRASEEDLDRTAGEAGDPSSLVGRFGSGDSTAGQ